MSDDYGYKREPPSDQQAQALAQREDFSHYDLRARLSKVWRNDTEVQKKYDASRERLLSSPLLTPEILKKTMINNFVNYILEQSLDPFDSFCEVVSHFLGVSKEEYVQRDADERAKILGESDAKSKD